MMLRRVYQLFVPRRELGKCRRSGRCGSKVNRFLRVTARSAKRVLAIVILSDRLSILVTRPGTLSKPNWDRLRVFTIWWRTISSFFVTKFHAAGCGGFPRYPLQSHSFTVVESSSMRTVADRHRLADYHNMYCWRAFQRYQHQWPWTILNPKYEAFSVNFSRFQAATHILTG